MADLQKITMEEVVNYNNHFYKEDPRWRLSEQRAYDEDKMKYFIEDIRPNYEYVGEYSSGKWVEIPITKGYAKFGTYFIYVDHERKLWRTYQTMSEFYRGGPVD